MDENDRKLLQEIIGVFQKEEEEKKKGVREKYEKIKAAKKPERKRTTKADKLLKEWKVDTCSRSISLCLKAAINRGNITTEHGLESLVWKGNCNECVTPLSYTIRDLLYQPDRGDTEGEDALPCTNKECEFAWFIGHMCSGDPKLVYPTSHHHCEKCSGLGKCIGDYRNEHCSLCDAHVFIPLFGPVECYKCGTAICE